MKKAIIFGAGQIAEVVHYYLTTESGYSIHAFCIDDEFVGQSHLLGLPVVPASQMVTQFPPSEYEAFVAMSFKSLNRPREQKTLELEKLGYRLLHFIHPKTAIWRGFKPTPNTFIMENNTLQPFVSVGRNTIIWSGNHIGHHTNIGNHCFIASHAVISGSVNIGDHCFIGVNATIRDNINIAEECVIGAGALILKSTKVGEVYTGTRSSPLARSSAQLKAI